MRSETQFRDVLDLLERERFRRLTRDLVTAGVADEEDAPVLAFLLTALEWPDAENPPGDRRPTADGCRGFIT